MAARGTEERQAESAEVVEGKMRDLLRNVVRSTKPQAQNSSVIDEGELPFIASMAAAPIREIERLLSELQESRTFLSEEAQRIERQIARYTEVSAGALDAAKIVTRHMTEWGKAHAMSETLAPAAIETVASA
jgi:hypothetical protein